MKTKQKFLIAVVTALAFAMGGYCGAKHATQTYSVGATDGVTAQPMTVTDLIGFLLLIQADNPEAQVAFVLDGKVRRSVRYIDYDELDGFDTNRRHVYWQTAPAGCDPNCARVAVLR